MLMRIEHHSLNNSITHFLSLVRSSSTIKAKIGLTYLGSCPLHLIHNSFKIGIHSTDWTIEDLITNLVLWFRYSPSRREDYLQITKTLSNDIGKFIPHFTTTRWLEIGSVLERVIEQWAYLEEYFIRFIPTKKKMSINKERYLLIKANLQTKLTLIRFKFLVFLSHNIYRQILVWFQSTEPLIHLLHDECEQLIRRLFSHFISENFIKNKTLDELIRIPFGSKEYQKSNAGKMNAEKDYRI